MTITTKIEGLLRAANSLTLLGALALAAGCATETSGPEPQINSLDPSLVCVEQLVTTVSIAGDELSPLVFDSLTDNSGLALPDITLQRVASVSGEPVTETEVVLPNDPTSAHVRWTDQQNMEFDVYPEPVSYTHLTLPTIYSV